MIQFLFVYGTLHPKLAPPSVAAAVRRLQLVGRGNAYGVLYDLGEYPGAKFDEASSSVIHGEVYRLPRATAIATAVLRDLDKYESVDTALFVRKTVWVTVRSGNRLLCWAYQYNRLCEGAPIVVGGRYDP
jgi:gamma-glutamylcyclotransferase (GGCT)/AIG2-like uncharacterized protein YtfP